MPREVTLKDPYPQEKNIWTAVLLGDRMEGRSVGGIEDNGESDQGGELKLGVSSEASDTEN